MFSWCYFLELPSQKIIFITLTCNSLNDGLQNKGAGRGNHGPNRGFLPVEFDPWRKPGWVALLTAVLNSAWCKFDIAVQGFILKWKPVFTLSVEGKALGAREYIQFILLGEIWRIYAWSLPQYIFCCYSLYLLYRRGNFTRCWN